MEQTTMTMTKPEIQEDLLTLEDAALLADPNGQLPADTLHRVRKLARTDSRVMPLFDYLEALAEAADIPPTSDRLHVGYRSLEEIERLEQTADWRHPAEVLDPTGDVGISYSELVKLAAMRARQAGVDPEASERGKAERYRAIERQLERAWAAEKARDQAAEDFAARLCEVEPAEAERLLRHATRRYQDQRRQPVGLGEVGA